VAAESETTAGDPLVGQTLSGRYRIEGLLGEGGVGRVYRATHLELRRAVALKVLSTEHLASDLLRQRFRREAEALAALSHPHIVGVTDFDVEDGKPYLVMELLEGRSLAELMKDESLAPARALDLARQMLRALAYAHSRNVVHRDLKPQNIFVRKLDEGIEHATVLDFGLARFVGSSNDGRPLTRTGMVIGTPAYMAPEQASGDATNTDARTDVYAMGLVLFEMLCGRRPFDTNDPGKLMRAHLLEAPPTLAAADPSLRAPQALEDLIARALEKRPADRFADGGAMLAALDGVDPASVTRDGRGRRVTGDLVSAPTLAASPASRDRSIARDKKRSGAPLAVILAGFGLALAGTVALIVAAVALSGEDDEPVAPPPPPPPPVVVEPPPPPPEPEPPRVRDPLVDPLPEEIAPLWAQVQRERQLSRTQVTRIRTWIREEGDVRGYLILARNYTEQRDLTHGFEEYENAMERDRTVRGFPPMLPDLLEMARSGTLHRRATAAIVNWYGADARTAVEGELAREDLRREERARYDALLVRLPRE
jgi:serine/threonine protein kinase